MGAKEAPDKNILGEDARQTPLQHVFSLLDSKWFAHLSPLESYTRLTSILVIFAVSLVTSLSAGFALGAWSTYRERNTAGPSPPSATKSNQQKDAQDDSGDEEELADGDLSAVKPGFLEPCKMVCMQLILP